MNNNRKPARRAGVLGLALAATLTVVGASPSAAATYTVDSSKLASTYQFDFNYYDLAAARIARVGITPIPIP